MSDLNQKSRNRTPNDPWHGGEMATLAMMLVAAAAYLYLSLFVARATPVLLVGDQTYYWMNAQRMMFGELPYKDFLQITPPSTDVVYFWLFEWLGPRVWVANFVVLVLGLVLCWVCYGISHQIMSRRAALLATGLFLVLAYGKLLNATHHWFSVLFILCAVRIAMPGVDLMRTGFAGAALGVAAFFTQTHAAAAAGTGGTRDPGTGTRPARYILWAHYLDERRSDQSMADPLPPFLAYRNEHYRRAWTFSNGDEIWERK